MRVRRTWVGTSAGLAAIGGLLAVTVPASGASVASASRAADAILHRLQPSIWSRAGTARERALLTARQASFSVPRSVPAGGVAILVRNGRNVAAEAFLHRASAPPVISQAQAEADALQIDNAPGLQVSSATYANVTVAADVSPPGGPPLSSPSLVVDRNVWVVVVTAPSPVGIPMGCTSAGQCPEAQVSNDTLLLDPVTGTLLYGFFS
jgi:hypothetical protein